MNSQTSGAGKLKIGYFLTARLGSSRLPRKHLLEANGRALLEVLARRILLAFAAEFRTGEARLVIVTSDEPENREFERFTSLGAEVFYGSKQNIPLRHLQAAQARGVDAIVAVDGDDILCSIDAVQAVREGLLHGEDYANTSGLPLGMNAFGYNVSFLQRSLRGNEQNRLETGWDYIFDTTKLTTYPMHLVGKIPENLRFTLDYPEDYAFFCAIIEYFGEQIFSASDQEIVDYVVARCLSKITAPIVQKYWQDFQTVRDSELGQPIVGSRPN
jgi:spore coat polysaccharide biosynthesis protein SpsF (cytidylyltransferase family)